MSTDETLFESFGSYPFDQDSNFQEGLAAVLAQENSGTDNENMIGRAKAYYFSTITGKLIKWEDYISYKSGMLESKAAPAFLDGETSELSSIVTSVSDSDVPALSFAQITALIESGQTDKIPNNEIIPQGLNDANPSLSTQEPRKKPWELLNTGTDV